MKMAEEQRYANHRQYNYRRLAPRPAYRDQLVGLSMLVFPMFAKLIGLGIGEPITGWRYGFWMVYAIIALAMIVNPREVRDR